MAHQGICRESLRGSGAMTQEKINEARQHRDKAKACESVGAHAINFTQTADEPDPRTGYDEAKRIDGMPAPPMKDFELLETELKKCFEGA